MEQAPKMQVVVRNIARCLRCGDVIESKHRHDFVMCMCGAIFTDGGREYIRRGGDPSLMEDLSQFEEDEVEP